MPPPLPSAHPLLGHLRTSLALSFPLFHQVPNETGAASWEHLVQAGAHRVIASGCVHLVPTVRTHALSPALNVALSLPPTPPSAVVTIPFVFAHVAECSSTQDVVYRAASEWRRSRPAGPAAAAVSADAQRVGRGRRGRDWTTGSASPIATSISIFPAVDAASCEPVQGQVLTFAARAVAAAPLALLSAVRAVDPAAASRLAVKWPNDVYVQSMGKVAGFLVDCEADRVTVGLGCNVGTVQRTPDMTVEPASLAALLPDIAARDGVASLRDQLLTHFWAALLHLMLGDETLSTLVDRLRGVSLLPPGTPILVHAGPRGVSSPASFGATVIEWQLDGRLAVQVTETGERLELSGQEVSVRQANTL